MLWCGVEIVSAFVMTVFFLPAFVGLEFIKKAAVIIFSMVIPSQEEI